MNQNLIAICVLLLLTSCATQQNVSTTATPLSEAKTIYLTPNTTPPPARSVVDEIAPAKVKSSPAMDVTKILWDKWGVPHIYAKNNEELFYAFGWSQMHNHGNTILKLYAKSRGRAAEYWGEKYLENDMMVHALGFPDLSLEWYKQQTPEFQGYIDHFARGLNDYASAYPGTIEDQYSMVLPIEDEDILRHAIFVLYSRFIGGGDLSNVSAWEERGSNTYAIAPSRSESGNAMLVMNPHLPWSDEWLFYEGHFNAPGVHTYGATLVGLPTLGIAFNEHLGWSHTNNTIDNADRFELTLKDGGYVVDGEVRQFEVSKMSIKVKGDDGSLLVREIPRLVAPDFGPVLSQKGNKALTLKMPGFDRPYGIVQWWKMSNARNLEEFQEALKEVQIGFFNIMYADKEGNIFYMFNGQVPKRKVGGWDEWSGTIDGSKSEHIWTDVHTYEELPKTSNPKSGYLQNANDPPWTSTFPMQLDPNDYPPYMSPVIMGFRPQRAVRMIEGDKSITFDELVEYKMSTRIEMADRLLDDLQKAVEAHGTDKSRRAMEVLLAWDREANADSKGMAVFYAWAVAFGPWERENYEKDWSLDDAWHTPDGISDPQRAVQILDEVVEKFDAADAPLNIPWGFVYRIKYGEKNLPGNGAAGFVGVFRVAWSDGPTADGRQYISGGDSWQSVIEFGDKIRAKVLMSYGNSTQKGSPNYGDQLELFSKKQLRECTFYREDVERAAVRTEIIQP